MRGSELPAGHKDREYEGRFVNDCSKSSVRDEYNSIALFEDLGSSPATLGSSKIVDPCWLLNRNEQR